MKHTFLYLIFLFISTVSAQEYPFVAWSGARGVPRDIITDIVQDQRGFLWVGTAENGLLRLDGKEVARPDDARQRLPQSVFALAVDGNDHLFVGGNRGITVLRLASTGADSVETAFTKRLAVIEGPVRILDAREGQDLYVETAGGSWRVDFRDSTIVPVSPRSRPYAFLEAHLPEMDIRDMARDCLGRYWLATDQGLLLKDDVSSMFITVENGFAETDIRSVCVDREANIWCGSSTGLYMHTPGRVTKYSAGTSLPAGVGSVRCILETSEHGIMLGTAAGGMLQLFNGDLQHMDLQDGLPSNTVNCMLELPSGDILIGTDSGIAVYDGERLLPAPPPIQLTGWRVTTMKKAADQCCWIGSSNGLLRWKNDNVTLFNDLNGLPAREVTAVAEDPFGIIWVGTRSGLARVLSTRQQDVQIVQEFQGKRIRALHFDSRDRLWIAAAGMGVYVRGDEKLVRLTTEDGLASNSVSFITEDNYGSLYFGSSGGISVLPQENVQYLMPVDSVRLLWRRVPPAQLPFLKALAMYTLNTEEGFPMAGLPTAAALRDHAGRMWFGSTRGVSSYNPARPSGIGRWKPPICRPVLQSDEGAVHYSILLRDVCIGDTCTDQRDRVVLGSDEHVLRLRCLLPSFRNPGRVRFLYQLQGMEYSWHSSDDGRILYTGLKPGSYMLAVQADVGDGVWTRRQELIQVIVEAPFYESIWFWITLLVLAVLLVFVLQRQRYIHMLDRERLRTKEIQRSVHTN